MPYSDGSWGEKAKQRSIKRKKYFLDRMNRKKKGIYIVGKWLDSPDGGSASKIGRIGEINAIKVLKGAIDLNKKSPSKYDIDWNGNKIDVKTSHLLKDGTYEYYGFTLSQKEIVNYFIFLLGEI